MESGGRKNCETMLADIYVLVNSRSGSEVNQFLDFYIPLRHEMQTVYEVTQSNEEDLEFHSPGELMDHMEKHPLLYYHLAFHNVNDQAIVRNAGIYYTSDSQMIFRLTIRQNDEIEELLLNELKDLFSSQYGYISYHVPPEKKARQFVDNLSKF